MTGAHRDCPEIMAGQAPDAEELIGGREAGRGGSIRATGRSQRMPSPASMIRWCGVGTVRVARP